jgi:hypothetical protein
MLKKNASKVIHNTDIQYLRSILHQKYTSVMHNLHSNFDKFFNITKSIFQNRINSFDTFFSYRNKPKMSNFQIIALAITDKTLGIDSENYFGGKLKSDHTEDFHNLIDHSNFNRHRKRLYPYIKRLNQTVSNMLNEGENIYLVDSISFPVCKIAREKQSKIGRGNFETPTENSHVLRALIGCMCFPNRKC